MIKEFLILLVLLNCISCASINLPVTVVSELDSYDIEIKDNANQTQQHQHSTLRRMKKVEGIIEPQSNNLLYVNVAIGNPPQEIKLRLSTKDQYVWVLNNTAYNLSLSSSGKNSSETVTLQPSRKEGVVTQDDMKIGDIIIKDFPFIVLYKETSFFDSGCLGLGKAESKSKQLNFIDTLYEKNLITRKVFYLTIDEAKKQNTLSIGEYPQLVEKEQNRPYFHKHKMLSPKENNGLTKISVHLSGVFIGGESKLWEVNDNASFSYGANYILVSWDFFAHLRDFFFKADLASEVCEIKENNLFEYILCFTSKFGPKESISFILGDWTYKFHFNEYLLKYENKDSRMIAFVKNKKFNGWSFGYHFYRKYLTVFDIQDGKIGIYYHP